ncbi:MAG TPA: FHA domain-containing protein [Syntrophobacteria bacterium]|nr:FHA domain-containing protein [Syntrophobacteria bacterium]
METSERRRSTRLHRQFVVHLRSLTGVEAEGESENVSQVGAFVKTERWIGFKTNDEVVITFCLPPDFTGQDNPIGLRGDAVVTRIDPGRQGVGVAFARSFRQFEQVSLPDVTGRMGEGTVASCLFAFAELPVSEFLARYPHGFLVEYSRRAFDKDVILQLDTQHGTNTDLLGQGETPKKDVFQARVLALKKSTLATEADKVIIGRSPTSDLVFQNKLVSRRHAYFSLPSAGKESVLVDTESTNGTFVNTKKLRPYEEHPLAEGDEILFGHEVRVVYFSSQAFHRFLRQVSSTKP